MTIDTNTIVSVTEANQNFSRVKWRSHISDCLLCVAFSSVLLEMPVPLVGFPLAVCKSLQEIYHS